MAKFESKETEEYFYQIAQKYGIMHVLWEKDHVITKEDVDCLANTSSGYIDKEIRRETFEEFP